MMMKRSRYDQNAINVRRMRFVEDFAEKNLTELAWKRTLELGSEPAMTPEQLDERLKDASDAFGNMIRYFYGLLFRQDVKK